MGFNYYQIHHLHENVHSKNHIDSELNKKPNHADVDTKIDTVNHYFMHCLFNKEIEQQKILFYGSISEFLMPFDLVVKDVAYICSRNRQQYTSRKVFNSIQ